jgi:hypothetical protein
MAVSIESERPIRINSEDVIPTNYTNPKTPRTPSGNIDSNLLYIKKSFYQLLKTNLGLLLLNRQNLLRLIGFTVQWTVGLFIFTILTINIQQLGLSSININGIFVGVAGMFGAGLVIFMITKIRRYVCGFVKIFFRKTGIIWCLVTIIVASVVLAVLSYFYMFNVTVQFIESMISAFIFKCATLFIFSVLSLYSVELFETSIRSLAFALVMVVSKLITSLTPEITNFASELGIHVLSTSAIPALIAIPITLMMPETFESENND